MKLSSHKTKPRTSYVSESLMAKRGRFATEARMKANRTGVFGKPHKNTVTKPDPGSGSLGAHDNYL